MKYEKFIAGATLAAVMAIGLAFVPVSSATSLGAKTEIKTEAQLKNKITSLAKRFSWLTNWEGNINLNNTIKNGMLVKGRASIKRDGSLYNVNIKFRAENFPPITTAAGTPYEVWLIADSPAAAPNSSPLYQLSLGAMVPDAKGRADFNFSEKMINPKLYTRLVITQEVMNDTDPRPGTAVFSADLSSLIFKEVSLRTTLVGKNEVPAVSTSAAGKGQFIINTRDNTLKYDVWVTDLSSTETAAHIHGPARAGANAGVLVELPKGNHIKGTWAYDQSLENSILSGETYINIHTEKNPNGEIRGQIVF